MDLNKYSQKNVKKVSAVKTADTNTIFFVIRQNLFF